MRLIAALVLAAVVIVADDAPPNPPPNQASNAKLRLEGTAIPKPADVAALLGVKLGEGYIVVRMRAAPKGYDPLRLSAADFTLVSRKDGERSRSMDPDYITLKDEIAAKLKSRAFPEVESSKPVEGLLYFQLEGKLAPKNLGLIYDGPAGHLAMDFK